MSVTDKAQILYTLLQQSPSPCFLLPPLLLLPSTFLQTIPLQPTFLQAGVFKAFDDMYPVVSCTANFDEILIPADHVSRSPNDTYYVSADKVLRCHTSAHQAELLRTKQPAFLVTGRRCVVLEDRVYRALLLCVREG
jgi:hypothetical protein